MAAVALAQQAVRLAHRVLAVRDFREQTALQVFWVLADRADMLPPVAAQQPRRAVVVVVVTWAAAAAAAVRLALPGAAAMIKAAAVVVQAELIF